MADAIWYYAQDDREHGPVTGAHIAGMARSGKLRPDDLVWREGMEDWRPARAIKGLFHSQSEDVPSHASDTAVLEAPLGGPPSAHDSPPEGESSPHGDATGRDAAGGANSTALSEPPPPPVVGSVESRSSASASKRFDSEHPDANLAPSAARRAPSAGEETFDNTAPVLLRQVCRALIGLGLMTVVLARGCDSLGNRYVQRLAAQAQMAAATAAERPKVAPSAAASNVRASAADLTMAARMAAWRQQMWAFWRGLATLVGALLLTMGAFGIAVAGDRADRWLGFALLAVIAWTYLQFSLPLVDNLVLPQ